MHNLLRMSKERLNLGWLTFVCLLMVGDEIAGSNLTILGQRNVAAPQLFKAKEFNFEKLGIGGLDDQFEQIFRRAFASRVFPPSVVERLGIRHVKGVLLFGPPGTGAAVTLCLLN